MSFVLIRVGNSDRPASSEDVTDIRRLLSAIQDDGDLDLVTHHAITFDHIEKADGVSVWKLGDQDFPASTKDIENFQQELIDASSQSRPVVWNHLVTYRNISLFPDQLLGDTEDSDSSTADLEKHTLVKDGLATIEGQIALFQAMLSPLRRGLVESVSDDIEHVVLPLLREIKDDKDNA
jgi:hypothetical protein